MKHGLICTILAHLESFMKSTPECRRNYVIAISVLVSDFLHDKKFGIQTGGSMPAVHGRSAYPDGQGYVPYSYASLQEAFSLIMFNRQDIFVDLGCGKGRVVLLAAMRKIRKVIGVECDPELVRMARCNLGNFRSVQTPVEWVVQDAAQYVVTDETIFYMYNAFGEMTLERVLLNIKASLQAHPRQVHIVYCNPEHRNVVDAQPWLYLKKKIENTRSMILVWSNEP